MPKKPINKNAFVSVVPTHANIERVAHFLAGIRGAGYRLSADPETAKFLHKRMQIDAVAPLWSIADNIYLYDMLYFGMTRGMGREQRVFDHRSEWHSLTTAAIIARRDVAIVCAEEDQHAFIDWLHLGCPFEEEFLRTWNGLARLTLSWLQASVARQEAQLPGVTAAMTGPTTHIEEDLGMFRGICKDYLAQGLKNRQQHRRAETRPKTKH